jgi:hypothetical protein
MGMRLELKQITPDFLTELIAIPSLIEDARDEGATAISLDKAWAAIHFMLIGTDKRTRNILSRAILGSVVLEAEEIAASNAEFADQSDPNENPDEEIYLGYTYYLTPTEVIEAAAALLAISEDDFRKKYDPAQLLAHYIYGGNWVVGDNIDLEQFILPNYRDLVKYYQDAAKRGNGMLVTLE